MVASLHAFHDAIERGLAPWNGAIVEAGYRPAPRTALLRQDLADLSADPGDTRVAAGPETFGEALGWLYVAEGSALGGRVMRQAMVRDGIPLSGLGFLDPHGEQTGPRWRAFLHTMEAACASGRAIRGDVVKGGCDAFALAFRLLGSPSPELAR